MISKPDDFKLKVERTASRRSLFKWMGQVAVGASLASIGLGLADPINAGAASSPKIPNCRPCPAPGTTYAVCLCPSPGCSSNKDGAYIHYQGGCTFDGTGCDCPVTYTNGGFCCSASDSCYC